MAGQVFSFESNSHHMSAAINNYNLWRTNWKLTHSSAWPDNVTFVEGDVRTVRDCVASPLDAVSPHCTAISLSATVWPSDQFDEGFFSCFCAHGSIK